MCHLGLYSVGFAAYPVGFGAYPVGFGAYPVGLVGLEGKFYFQWRCQKSNGGIEKGQWGH